MPNGAGFGFGDVLDALGSALQDLTLAILDSLVAIINFLFELAAFTWEILLAVANFLWGFFSRVLHFFRAIWKLGFHGVVGKLWSAFRTLRDFLHRILDPVISRIHDIIDYETRLFNTYLRPALNLIQRLRTSLVLFRLLHVKWAARLDARLAQIEGRIGTLGLGTLRELNTIRNYLSLILDPFGLFNPFIYVQSALRSITDLWNALHNAQERPLFASEQDAIAKRRAFSQFSNLPGLAQQFAAGGDDPDRLAMEEAAKARLAGLTGYDGSV